MVHGQAVVTFNLCRSSFFWDVTQRWLAVSYRRFGTTYRYHRQVSSSPRVYAIRDFVNLGVGMGAYTSLPTGTISNTELPSVFVLVVQPSPYLVASFTLFCAELARTYQSGHCIQRCFVTCIVSCIWAGWSGVWFSAGERDCCLLQNVYTVSGACPPSYPLAGKGVKLSSHFLHLVSRLKNEWICTSAPPACLQGVHGHNFTPY